MNRIDIARNVIPGFVPMAPDFQGWNGDSYVFGKFVSEMRPKTIIEVGSWKGQSAISMAKAVRRYGLETKIYCVDTWLGALEFWSGMEDTPERNLMLTHGYPLIYYQFLSNLMHAGVDDLVIPFPTTSFIGARYFQRSNVQADLIYIDGSHEKNDVLKDLEEYTKVLSPKGMIFGDDYNWEGVREAVNEFTAQNGLTFTIEDDYFWVIRRS